MTYRNGFRRIGIVLTLCELAFWVGLVLYGNALRLMRPETINDWNEYRRGLLVYGLLPVFAYWIAYGLLGWIIQGFTGDGRKA